MIYVVNAGTKEFYATEQPKLNLDGHHSLLSIDKHVLVVASDDDPGRKKAEWGPSVFIVGPFIDSGYPYDLFLRAAKNGHFKIGGYDAESIVALVNGDDP